MDSARNPAGANGKSANHARSPDGVPSRRPSNMDYLTIVNQLLSKGWIANVNRNGRIYYYCHATQTTQWVPPIENWDSGEWRLPYGWECATDQQGRIYFINHLDKTTSYDDPRLQVDDADSECELFPTPREVTLKRDPSIGFGFVAGSEKPVIVRFVNEDGPSAGKLLPSDLILKINGEDVEKAPRDHVIELVRSCKESVTLVVCQPQIDNASRKSAFLSAAKKARLKSKPSRVRFADGVHINGSTNSGQAAANLEPGASPFIPNVLKVFLENGQTKSFKYDGKTTVRDVMNSLKEKLSIKAIEHFALVTEHVRSYKKNQLKILSPDETIAKIAAKPGAQHLRCLFRVTFIPRDAFDLLRVDPVAFDYFYMQCCNDVIDERFATELRCDVALRLAALQMQQHCLGSNVSGKVSVKRIEKDCGLERFIPPSILEAMKHKELRRLLSHLIKVNNQQLCPAGQKRLTEAQIKVHYLKILAEMTTFGGRCFNVLFPDTKTDGLILVSPKFGLSQISGTATGAPVKLTELEAIREVVVSEVAEAYQSIEIVLKPPRSNRFAFETENADDLDDMVQMLNGYSRLFLGVPLRVHFLDDSKDDGKSPSEPPPYYGRHSVYSMPWSYPAELRTVNIQLSDQQIVRGTSEHQAEFGGPPSPTAALIPQSTQPGVPEGPPLIASPPSPAQKALEDVSATDRPPIHIDVKLPPATLTNGRSPTMTAAQTEFVRNMRFIDDSTSSELDTPVAERALRLANLHSENDLVYYQSQIEAALLNANCLQSGQSANIVRPTGVDFCDARVVEQLAKFTADDERIMDLGSESDETDSVSTTPTESPRRRITANGMSTGHRIVNPPSTLFRSGSSFGLHSPDDIAKFKQEAIQVFVDGIAEIESSGRGTMNEESQVDGQFCHDSDIIDLCQIPIPEEQEPSENHAFTNIQVPVPPTPFRDPLVPFPGNEHSDDYLPDIQEDETLSTNRQGPTASLDDALRELNSFIAAMTIPDPEESHSRIHRVTSADIRSLMIPPPPLHSPTKSNPPPSSTHAQNESPSSSGVESVQRPPVPPKPKIIPPPPPPRNKSLERNGRRATQEITTTGLVYSIEETRRVSDPYVRRNSKELENSEAYRDCVAEINAQLSEIAQRKTHHTYSSESELVSTTPSASEENTPVMWRKNPVLIKTNSKKPPIIGGIHPNATLPFSNQRPPTSQNRARYRTRPPPPRKELRKRLQVVRVQSIEGGDEFTNGNGDDEDEEGYPRPYGATVTKMEFQMSTGRRFEAETDAEVLARVSGIIAEIDWTLDSIQRTDAITPNPINMRLAREQLVSEARKFVTASKALVKNSTVLLSGGYEPASLSGSGNEMDHTHRGGRPTSLAGHPSLRHSMFHDSLVRCTDLIGMMFHSATMVAKYSPTVDEAVSLIEGILDVSLSFRTTIETALCAPNANIANHEHSLHDPAVKLLMSEATKLAASLTTLMKKIRNIEGAYNGGSEFQPRPLEDHNEIRA